MVEKPRESTKECNILPKKRFVREFSAKNSTKMSTVRHWKKTSSALDAASATTFSAVDSVSATTSSAVDATSSDHDLVRRGRSLGHDLVCCGVDAASGHLVRP